MSVPSNSRLPSSWEVPGVFFELNLAGQGAGVGALDKRLLLLGYRLSSGTQPPDQPLLVSGQSDANDFFGQGSDLARLFAAAVSQVGGGVLDIWCCGINEPSGGTLATHLINVAGTATQAGSVDVYVCGYRASVPIASGDTATVVASALKAELDKLADLPITTAINGSNLTLTARHKGLVGNDLPLRVDQSQASGITFSPGTLTFANPAVGSGVAQVKVSTTTITAAITDQDSANTIASNVAAALNAGGYPVTASAQNGVVTLLYAKGRYVHRISAAIVTTTGTTVTPAAGATVADSGTNRPTLTTALTNIAGLPGFSCWATAFNDTTTLGTLSSFIEGQGDGRNQKGQMLNAGSTDTLSGAGGVPTGTTPLLTASPRYSIAWCPESPQQAHELAARTAAMVCAEDYAPRNYDGRRLATDVKTPLLLPPRAARPSRDDQNAAMHSYYLTPLVVDDVAGALAVLSGKTTSAATDLTLHDWGTIRHLDYLRVAFNARLTALFRGANLRRNGTPRTPNTVTVDGIRDAAYVLAIELDAVDLYDGAEAFKSGFRAELDAIVPTRVNCFIPLAVIRSLHQLGVVGAPA